MTLNVRDVLLSLPWHDDLGGCRLALVGGAGCDQVISPRFLRSCVGAVQRNRVLFGGGAAGFDAAVAVALFNGPRDVTGWSTSHLGNEVHALAGSRVRLGGIDSDGHRGRRFTTNGHGRPHHPNDTG